MKPRSISSTRALLSLFAAMLLAWNAHGFCTSTYRYRASKFLPLHESDNNNDDINPTKNKEKEISNDNDSYSWAELQADEKLRQLELQKSINRRNNMLLPQRISQAVTTLGWTFVVTGIVLNSLGFAWVKKPEGGLGIGTLDQRNFQRELYRRSEDSTKDANNMISRASGAASEGNVRKWISLVEYEQDSC
eukprot:scaffold4603_cov128-Skeletonema_dohrnii-CCMP3373.AAC.4